jgi:hypothetical protein
MIAVTQDRAEGADAGIPCAGTWRSTHLSAATSYEPGSRAFRLDHRAPQHRPNSPIPAMTSTNPVSRPHSIAAQIDISQILGKHD